MPLLGAGRNVSPRMQNYIDTWLTDNGWTQGGGSSSGPMTEAFDDSASLPTGFVSTGDAPWFVQGTTFYSTPHAAESGNIGDNQVSSLILGRDGLTTSETISFRYKTSTENGYDKLKFYINNVFIDEWSGDSGGFQLYSTSCVAGLNTFEWRYVKDTTQSSNADTVWIDNIVIS